MFLLSTVDQWKGNIKLTIHLCVQPKMAKLPQQCKWALPLMVRWLVKTSSARVSGEMSKRCDWSLYNQNVEWLNNIHSARQRRKANKEQHYAEQSRMLHRYMFHRKWNDDKDNRYSQCSNSHHTLQCSTSAISYVLHISNVIVLHCTCKYGLLKSTIQ